MRNFSAVAAPASGVTSRSAEPDCTAARWNRPLAPGMARTVEVFAPPPDWPKIITLPGSPPNASILAFTHCSEATMSSAPQTPAYLNASGAPALASAV